VGLAIILGGCTPAAPDIRVFRRHHALVVDFPWSVWRIIGLEDRSLCLRHIQVFDAQRVVWREDVSGGREAPCVDLRVPIPIGVPSKGFVSDGPLKLQAGRTYGVALDDLTEVDFVPFADKSPQNIVDFSKFIQPPCEADLGSRCASEVS
jgi:hypothetical protein